MNYDGGHFSDRYRREPDVAMSRLFRNGEDIAVVVGKLQALSVEAHGGGTREERSSVSSADFWPRSMMEGFSFWSVLRGYISSSRCHRPNG